MNRSYSKIRHIQELNLKLENRLMGKKILMEYDIDDESMNSELEQELASIASDVKEYMPSIDFSSPQSAINSFQNSEICSIGNNTMGFIERKFGKKVSEMFPNNPVEIIKQLTIALDSLIDYISTLKFSDLKSFFKTLKSKIKEAKSAEEKQTMTEQRIIKEFFGTSMALMSIGPLELPALIFTIGSYVIVGLVGLWLLNELLCSFNIKITKLKGCKARSFEWGQCKDK